MNSESALAKFLRMNPVFSQDGVTQALESTSAALRANLGKVGINGGSYAYYPANNELTKWRSSDGSLFWGTLLEVLLEYSDEGVFSSVIDGQLEDYLIRKNVDQHGFEGGKLKGGTMMNSERRLKAEKLVSKLVDNVQGQATATPSAEEFYDKWANHPDVWPDRYQLVVAAVDLISDAYRAKGEELYGSEMPEEVADQIYEMVHAGVF